MSRSNEPAPDGQSGSAGEPVPDGTSASAAGPASAGEPVPAANLMLRRTMIAVVFGGLMSMLDTTIVNIAIRTLSARLHSDLSSVQWVVTGYLLALAATLPLAGWLADRFGARRVYAWSIAVFTLASLACGLSVSTGELIGFRVLQGAAGALTMPVGQMILARVAGRARMARVMGTISIPILLAPVFGPVLGGLLLDHAGWQWIFFANLPAGLAAVPLALWLLPRDHAAGTARPDFTGLFLISAGSVAVTYGLASAGESAIRVALPAALGAALIGAFAVRSLRAARPLLDLRLYRTPAYAASSLVNFALGAAVFGGMILMPLYFQSVRHLDPVMTGLLVGPTGLGAAVATRLASYLTDRLGSGRTAVAGGLLSAAGTIPFLLIGKTTPYTLLTAAMAVRGIGISLCLIPAMTAAYRAIPPGSISTATTQLSMLNRLGGSAGAAVFAVVLQHGLAADAGAAAYGDAFGWALGAAAVALIPSAILASVERRQNTLPPPQAGKRAAAEHHRKAGTAGSLPGGVDAGTAGGGLRPSGARAFYCQPAYRNPTGSFLPAERREQVLAIAQAAGAFVIEDDACRWLSLLGQEAADLVALVK